MAVPVFIAYGCRLFNSSGPGLMTLFNQSKFPASMSYMLNALYYHYQYPEVAVIAREPPDWDRRASCVQKPNAPPQETEPGNGAGRWKWNSYHFINKRKPCSPHRHRVSFVLGGECEKILNEILGDFFFQFKILISPSGQNGKK